MKALFLSFFSLLAFAVYFTCSHEVNIRLHGSDLLDPWLTDFLKSNSVNESTFKIKTHLTGSYSGWEALQKKYADACIYLSSHEFDSSEGYQATCIGYFVLYTFAHENFPDPAISKDHIKRIGSGLNQRPIHKWKDILSDPAGWEVKNTRIVLDAGEKGLLVSQFRQSFLDGVKTNDKVDIATSQETLIQSINEDDAFLLFTHNPSPKLENLKLLSLIDFNDTVPFSPTPDNIQYEDYKATFPLYLILPQGAPYADSLLKMFRSEELKQLMRANFIYPTNQ